MSHMSNKDIDERNDALEIQCRECGAWFTPNTQHKWGGFCSEECLELHDAGQEAERQLKIEDLIHEPREMFEEINDKDFAQVTKLRNNKTLPLGG